jgi:hypothetical protein
MSEFRSAIERNNLILIMFIPHIPVAFKARGIASAGVILLREGLVNNFEASPKT